MQPLVEVVNEVDLAKMSRAAHVDLLVAAPKSVSLLLASLMSANRSADAFTLRMAHVQGVEATFNYLQNHCGLGSDGPRFIDVQLRIRTLDHIGAGGDTGDPHLHTHLVAESTAQTSAGTRLPVHLPGVEAALPVLGTIYDATLAQAIDQSGLSVAMVKDSGYSSRRQVAGISADVVAAFPQTACTVGFRQLVVTQD